MGPTSQVVAPRDASLRNQVCSQAVHAGARAGQTLCDGGVACLAHGRGALTRAVCCSIYLCVMWRAQRALCRTLADASFLGVQFAF